MIPSGGLVLRCTCCGLPFATVQNGVVVIQSKHHGETHTNVVAVAELMKAQTPAEITIGPSEMKGRPIDG